MSKIDQVLNCGAWIEVSTAEGRRRTCVLRAGHYVAKGAGVVSWHTDCPDVMGEDRPMLDAETHLVHGEHRNCTVWADWADGAHPSDVTLPEPEENVRYDEVPSLMENVIRAASDGPVMAPVELPTYQANVSFDTASGERVVSATLYGPAEFLATAVSVIAEEFQKEVEK